MRRVLGSPRRPRPGAQDQGPGYFGVTSHQQQQATRSGFARRVAGPTRRRGTPPPVASGEKVEGEPGNTRVRRDHAFLSWWSARVLAGGRALDHVHLSPSADAQVQGICTDEVARYRVRRNALMLRWAWVIHVDRVCHACVCDKFIPTRNCGLYCLATSIHESYFFLASECSSRILVPSSVGVKETEVTTDTDAAAIQDSCQNK